MIIATAGHVDHGETALVRGLTGCTRVIEILEWFDRMGITLRAGDLRTARKDFRSVFGDPP